MLARFARRHLWGICATVSVGSQCVGTSFACRYLWGICAAVSDGSQGVVARFARLDLWGICAAVRVGSQCVVLLLILLVFVHYYYRSRRLGYCVLPLEPPGTTGIVVQYSRPHTSPFARGIVNLPSKPCVNMLFLPLQSCTVEHMAKAKVLSERTECIPINKITPVIDEEPL